MDVAARTMKIEDQVRAAIKLIQETIRVNLDRTNTQAVTSCAIALDTLNWCLGADRELDRLLADFEEQRQFEKRPNN